MQALRHSPQFSIVRRLVSQPSWGLSLQSAQPPSHASISHMPWLQVAVCARAGAQGLPHASSPTPQFMRDQMFVSHPVSGSPSQLKNPGLQPFTTHVAFKHPNSALGP